MGGLFQGWPPEAVGGVALSALGNVWLAGQFMLKLWKRAEGTELSIHLQGWTRVKELEALIDLLRRVIDRARRRESVLATSFELLLVVLPETLTPAQRRAIERAEELFETGLLPLDGEGGGA